MAEVCNAAVNNYTDANFTDVTCREQSEKGQCTQTTITNPQQQQQQQNHEMIANTDWTAMPCI